MLSFNGPSPTWQTSVPTIAQQSSTQRPSFVRAPSASEVLPRLYLTDLFTACDEAQLTSLGITHVVSVIESAPDLPQTRSLQTLHIPLSDSSDADILTYLPTTTSFIRNALEASPDSRVMVHCLMGISRSATVVCAYLIATMRMTSDEALVAVRERRGIVCPNLGFLRQLEEYTAQVRGGGGKAWARRAKAEAIRKLSETLQHKGLNLIRSTSTDGRSPSAGPSPSWAQGNSI